MGYANDGEAQGWNLEKAKKGYPMKMLSRFFLPLVFVLLAATAMVGCGKKEATLGNAELDKPAPKFSLLDTEGNRVELAAMKGKVVFVNFWATWCPPCRAEMPSMETLYKTLKDDGLIMLAVNIEPNGRQTVADFIEQNPHTFPVLLDEQAKVQTLYGVYKFPESFILRKDGTIDDHVIGAIDWAHPEVINYFRSLLGV